MGIDAVGFSLLLDFGAHPASKACCAGVYANQGVFHCHRAVWHWAWGSAVNHASISSTGLDSLVNS